MEILNQLFLKKTKKIGLLRTLQNIEKEEQPDPEDFQKSMHKMSVAMQKFIQ
jgi:hypothetical protein